MTDAYGNADQNALGMPQAPTPPYDGQPAFTAYPPVAPAKRPWSRTAIIGFLVGLAVLAISLFSGFVIIAALPILWGIRAIAEVRRTGKRGMGFAIAGLVAGVLSGILFLLSFFPS